MICNKHWLILLFSIVKLSEKSRFFFFFLKKETEIRRCNLYLAGCVSIQFHKFRWYVVFILMVGRNYNFIFSKDKETIHNNNFIIKTKNQTRINTIHNNCSNRRDKVSKKGYRVCKASLKWKRNRLHWTKYHSLSSSNIQLRMLWIVVVKQNMDARISYMANS